MDESLPWCAGFNLTAVSAEEKYWLGLHCLNYGLERKWNKDDIYSVVGLLNWIIVYTLKLLRIRSGSGDAVRNTGMDQRHLVQMEELD